MTSSSQPRVVELHTERMATGGEAVARLENGLVIFVRGALDGETIRAEVTEEKKRFARGQTIEVLDASPMRVDPSCSHALSGVCGGCDWMFMDPVEQQRAKQQIVIEQLQRLGGVPAPVVTTAAMDRGRRTTVRCSVVNGRAGYRRRGTDDAFVANECGAAHPLIEELIIDGDFGDASEVTLRVGTSTGERLVMTDGDASTAVVPADVRIVNADSPGDAAIHEDVGGRRWRISARSFFQTSSEGGEALVAAVGRALDESQGDLVDLYAGVGLLGGGAAGERLRCAVESNPSSVADARHNLGADVVVVQARVERWSATRFETVIADPARRGLGKDGVAIIERTGAEHLVLVSCDPASLGRDTTLLIEQGWRHNHAEVIDMFPDTSRIEVVSRFTR